MLTFIIFYGIVFFVIGYILKTIYDAKQTKLEELYYSKLKSFNLDLLNGSDVTNRKSNIFLIKNKDIEIPSNVSSALQEIFDYVILKYINSWYLGFSNNEDFVVEIKYFFHILFAELLLRIKKIELVPFVTYKVVPVILNHLEMCRNIQKSLDICGDKSKATSNTSVIQDQTLTRLKCHLHVSMISRNEEVNYLRTISQLLIQYITPNYITLYENKSCVHFLRESFLSTVLLPGMDSLANPDIINKMICVALQPKSTITDSSSSQLVPILHRYQISWLEKLKAAKTHPKGIEVFIQDEKYFYHFLQFMKSIKTVVPINLFKQMDCITMKLLNPELDNRGKQLLFEDLGQLDKFLDETLESNEEKDYKELHINHELHERIREIIKQGPEHIEQLINCGIWMENYNAISQHVLQVYLPLYFESEYFLTTLYRDKNTWFNCYDSIDKRKEFSQNKFGSTLKNVLPSSTDQIEEEDDDILTSNERYMEMSTSRSNSADSGGGSSIIGESILSRVMELPDLSKIRIKIPSISQRMVERIELTFTIMTYKSDSEFLIARVQRKYADFYMLEQKLIEFHGSLGRSLPSRKIFEMRKIEFLDKCKVEFEDYLMFMISRPFLRNSQLLYGFLTDDSSEFINTDINITKFVKTVNIKLSTKKGQFLDPFLANYHTSCCIPNPPLITNDKGHNNVNEILTSMINTRMHLTQYWNNASLLNSSPISISSQICQLTSRFVFSFYDLLMVTIETITEKLIGQFRSFLLAVMIILQPYLSSIVDNYVINQMEAALSRSLQENNLVSIINMLKDSVLITGISRSSTEKAQRRVEAEQSLKKLIPDIIRQNLLPQSANEIIDSEIESLLAILQQPKLNKQLSYIILDLFLVELFPELSDNFQGNHAT